MRRIVLTRRVAVPPQDVFVFFVPQRMPYWYGPEMRASFETQGCGSDFRAGSTVRISATMANKTFSHSAVVTAFDRGRLFEWQFEDSYGVRGKERWELQPVENGAGAQTIIRFTNEYEVPGAHRPRAGLALHAPRAGAPQPRLSRPARAPCRAPSLRPPEALIP